MMVGSAAAPARLGAGRQTLCSASSRSIYLPMLAHRGPGFAWSPSAARTAGVFTRA